MLEIEEEKLLTAEKDLQMMMFVLTANKRDIGQTNAEMREKKVKQILIKFMKIIKIFLKKDQ